MSRAIKYRVWDNERNRYYVQPTELLWSQHGFREPYPSDGTMKMYQTDHEMFNVEPGAYDRYDRERFTLEQFTGLLDRNGREIYEGDIVSGKDPYDRGPVVWGQYHDDEYVAQLDTWMVEMPFRAPLSSLIRCPNMAGRCTRGPYISGLEVIGNIHENPELLQPTKT